LKYTDGLELKPAMVFQYSNDPKATCYAKLIMPDGRFSNFEIDRDMAHLMMIELLHHMKRQEGIIANAPENLPTASLPRPQTGDGQDPAKNLKERRT
tara:strand:+ start:1457 stop:1747 length:291 start_codon:yes stop_codon:yes gene_type:complete